MHSTEQLISPDFNDESYLRGVLHLSVEKWAKTEELRLAAAMEEVKKRTQVILAEHADDMVAHVEAIHAAQADATATRQLSASLSKASTRLGSMIEEPYLLVKSKVAELEHTTQAAEVLQAVLRFLSCFRRLEALSSSEDGLLSIRTAKALQEAQTLLHHDALRGVEVVESRAPLVERIARGVREAIHERLAVLDGTAAPTTTAAGEAAPVRTGTRTSEAITTALQCASILGTLPQVLQEFMRQQKQVVLRCLVVELDGQGIAEAMMRNKERPDAANPLLLQRIQHVLVVVLEHTQRVIQLWRQLLRQHLHLKLSTGRTNNNNNTSISGSGAHSSIALPLTASVVPTLADFWSAISEKLKERLLGMQGRTELMSVLTQHYPRYIFLLQSFLSTNEGGAAALVSDAAAVSKFGMSDYLELIQLVEAAVQERTVGPSTPRQNHTTEAIKRGWLQQVSGHLRTRFIATIMDRYREQLSPVFAALQEISPANISAANQPMPWRPTSSHSHAALNATNFLRFASGDAHHYRQDPHTLQLIVDAMLQCATQLRDRVAESARRAPLPPLPSVAGGITRGQYLNICIANMCSSLLLELAGILALLPDDQAEDPSSLSQQQHVLRHGDEGQEEADPWTEAVQALRQQRRALREVMQSLSTLAEASTTPFLSSATAMAMPLIASCISSAITTTTNNNNNNNSSAATPAQLQQLHALMEHFTTHWHVLVDAHVAGWMDGTRQTVDGLIAHTLVRCVLLHPVSATVDRVTTVKILTRTLSDTPIIMLRMLSGNNNNHNNFNSTNTSSVCLSRSTLLLKAAAKQMEAVFTRAAAAAEPHTTTTTTTTTNNNTAEMLQRELSGAIKALHPLLSRLLLLQLMRLDRHLPPTCGDVAGPEVAAHLTSEAFVEKVVEELLRVAHAATVANTTYNTNNNATSAESELQRLITAVDECYAEMMRCAATSPAAELYRRGWAEVVARGAAV